MKIIHVVGARPNFMKVAPVIRALSQSREVRQVLVHTGQHYDPAMSDVFFSELEIPEPDVNLGVGSGSHGRQTAEVMTRFEPVLLDHRPSLALVYGDVNSTLAAALVCAKLAIPVGHVEAGLRSFDRAMPEEINRLLTDQIADILFTPSSDANGNLRREGIPEEKIHFVGNVMIDTLVRLLPRASGCVRTRVESPYALVTLHRPSNVDDTHALRAIIDALVKLSGKVCIVFPVHPRTRRRIADCGVRIPANSRVRLLDPLSYLQFLELQRQALVVITDSGGIQEEATYLGIPCLTLRNNTERPVTVAQGTNILIGQDMDRLRNEVERVLAGGGKRGAVPPLWDGHAAERIADLVLGWKM